MKIIKLFKKTGNFAEDKDVARNIRIKLIDPSIKKGEEVVLDFINIESITQSFVHALISEVIRKNGSEVLDLIYFKNCNKNVENIVNIVVDYMQV